MKKAIFLDRDGVICEYREDYVKSWGEFRFLPGALAALNKLASLRLPVFVVSNQSCIGRGIVSAAQVDTINRRMVDQIRRAGGRIDDVLVCPHRPEEGCRCRKPEKGLLEKAAAENGLALDRCWLVGDNVTDIQMGAGAGCRTVLVRSGLGRHFEGRWSGGDPAAPLVAGDLGEAADIILAEMDLNTGS